MNGQCVECTSDTKNIFRVGLKESFTQDLTFVKVGEYEVAFAEGQVRATPLSSLLRSQTLHSSHISLSLLAPVRSTRCAHI